MLPSSVARRPQLLDTNTGSSGSGNVSDPITPFPTSITRTRTSHACNRCRAMRTKCSGGPRCAKCVKDDAACQYGDRKRERNKKDLAESVDRIHELEEENRSLMSALRSLVQDPSFVSARHEDVLSLIASFSNKDSTESSRASMSDTYSFRSPKPASEGIDGTSRKMEEFRKGAEDSIDSSVGSPGRQGELDLVVDLDHGMGAAGFVGKLSEMSWMQRAKQYLSKPSVPLEDAIDAVLDGQTRAAQSLNYFMDDTNLLSVDEDHIEDALWPSLKEALILSEACFFAMQGPFNFVDRETFFDTMAQQATRRNISTWSDRRWLAVANLIWAIGAKWLTLVKMNSVLSESHLVFYARARSLGLDHRILYDHPDIAMVRGIGLLAFYLLINGSVAKAWNILGNAIRHATALGLYLRVTDESISEDERRIRAHTWFSLYNLEILIVEVTGRPNSISANQITVPPETVAVQGPSRHVDRSQYDDLAQTARNEWLRFLRTEGARNNPPDGDALTWDRLAVLHVPSTYFSQYVQLCHISAAVATQLYIGSTERAWSETQEIIEGLQEMLDEWLTMLPDDLKLDQDETSELDPRARTYLAMYYHSVRMMLHRPCLCDIRIQGESDRSKAFNQKSARECLNAAISLLGLAPDDPSELEVQQLLPWWALLHYICQSTAVLLIEMCLDCQHAPNDVGNVVGVVHKAMTYLWTMSSQSMSAHRAWRIFRALLEEVAFRGGEYARLAIRDDAQQPDGWTAEAENLVLATIAQIGGR